MTQFELEFDNVRTCEYLQQIQNLMDVLSVLLSDANSWKNSCSATDFICTESADKPFFSQISSLVLKDPST